MIYNIQFSIQIANADVQIQDVDIWFKKGSGAGASSNIAASNSKFSIPESHGGTDGHLIAALNFFLELQPDDYFQIAWATTDLDCGIEQLPTQTSQPRYVCALGVFCHSDVLLTTNWSFYATCQLYLLPASLSAHIPAKVAVLALDQQETS